MKKILTMFTIVSILQITNIDFVFAQKNSTVTDTSGYLTELINEQRATNIIYSILYSTEVFIIKWNECIDTVDIYRINICKIGLVDSLKTIEKLLQEYISITQKPMLDTIRGKNMHIILSVVGNRIPTTKEAQLILHVHQASIIRAKNYIEEPTADNRKAWIEQFQKVRDLLTIYMNN